jgi:hypothetical protein
VESNASLIASVPYKLKVQPPSMATLRGRSPNISYALAPDGKKEMAEARMSADIYDSGVCHSASMITADDYHEEPVDFDKEFTSDYSSLIPQRSADAFIPHASATAVLPLNASYMVTKPKLAANKTVKGGQFPLPPVSTRNMSKKIIQQAICQRLGVDVLATDDISVGGLYELSQLHRRSQMALGPKRGKSLTNVRESDDRGLYLGITRRAEASVVGPVPSIVSGASNPRLDSQTYIRHQNLRSVGSSVG